MSHKDPALEAYFLSLPPLVQETIKQSGVSYDNLDQLKSLVHGLNQFEAL